MTMHLDQALTAALRELERQAAERGRVVRVQNPRGINIPFPVNLKLVLEVALMSTELAPSRVTPSHLLPVEEGKASEGQRKGCSVQPEVRTS